MNDTAGAGARDHFIPARKIDVLDALIAQGALPGAAEQDSFRKFCHLLGAIYHYQYFDQLERLRNDYFYFNPETDNPKGFDPAQVRKAYSDLIDALVGVLHGANFVEIEHGEVQRAHRENSMIRVEVEVPLDRYQEVRFFRRGHHKEMVEVPSWWGLRKRHGAFWVYDDVVLLVTMKSVQPDSGGPLRRRHKPKVRPGAVLLKYFRDIASADLNALFPDARVVMSVRDRLWIGVPALIGVVPIVIKLASTLTVLLVVASFYMGLAREVREADTAGAIAALTGLVALGGLIFRQWVKFQRQSLLYQKALTDNIYYRNINNNSGIFDYLIGEAEEQECKEAFLAYYFLRAAGSQGVSADQLDQNIEAWLRQKFETDVDFECDDALAKLDKLGLLRRDGERLSVPSLDDALTHLDGVWDNFFPYAAAPEARAAISR